MKLLVGVDGSENIIYGYVIHDYGTTLELDEYVFANTVLPNGVTVDAFLNNAQHYKVVGGASIELQNGHTPDDRIISSPDNTVPLTIVRANTVNGIAIL